VDLLVFPFSSDYQEEALGRSDEFFIIVHVRDKIQGFPMQMSLVLYAYGVGPGGCGPKWCT
jgi:hypothetical protein